MTSRTGRGLIVMAMSLLAFFCLGAAMLTGVLEALDRDLLLVLRGSGGLGDPVGSRGIEEAVRDLTALGGTTLVAVGTQLHAHPSLCGRTSRCSSCSFAVGRRMRRVHACRGHEPRP